MLAMRAPFASGSAADIRKHARLALFLSIQIEFTRHVIAFRARSAVVFPLETTPRTGPPIRVLPVRRVGSGVSENRDTGEGLTGLQPGPSLPERNEEYL
ncbi:hypothetical protein SAMN05428945_4601 [Streptomyces sp. 2224.1]|nr:hypothetical protein SAMN05428945_4601 [Streptomyces sp. 2224.1]